MRKMGHRIKWEEAAPSLLARDVSEPVLGLDFGLKCINFALDLVIRSRVRQGKRPASISLRQARTRGRGRSCWLL